MPNNDVQYKTLRDLVLSYDKSIWFKKNKENILFELNHLELHKLDGYLFYLYQNEIKSDKNPGNSNIAYLLDITSKTPTGRVKTKGGTTPDIDSDFEDEKRILVKEYLKNKYGTDRVSNIGTFQVSKCKGLFKDLARIFELSFDESNKISKLLPDDPEASIKDALEQKDVQQLIAENPTIKKIFEYAVRIEGSIRAVGVHASGIAITSIPITEIVPLFESKGEPVTQYDGETLEKLGIIKFDILGLKTLTVIAKTLELIKKTYKKDIDLYDIDLKDEKVYRLFDMGDLLGIFQVEGNGIDSFAKACKPRSIEELSAIIALYRPGPMGMGALDLYLKRIKNRTYNWEFEIPEFSHIFKDTYGLCIAEGERVWVKNKPIKIEDIELGTKLQGDNGIGIVTHKVNNGVKPCVRISVSNGHSIVCTKDHKILTNIGYISSKDLDPFKHLIAIPKHYITTIGLHDKKFAIVIAGLLAEGHLSTTSSYTFCNNDPCIRKRYSESLVNRFNLDVREYFNTRAWYVVGRRKNTYQNSLINYCKKNNLHGKNSYTKFIPDDIFELDFVSKCVFIGMYISCDGSITQNGAKIRTVSERLSYDLSFLLYSMGCYNVITRDSFGYYIHLNDNIFFNTYIKEHIVGSKKNVVVNKESDLGWNINNIYNKYIHDNISQREYSRKYAISRSSINKHTNFITEKQFNKINPPSPLRYVKIKDVIDMGNKNVWDISVSGVNSFIVNSMIVHNCVYQEQLMRLSREMCGFTDIDADELRKAVGKKDRELLLKQKEKFINGAISFTKQDKNRTAQLFDSMEEFSCYAFNASHSISYAFIAYQTAWLKTYYKKEYLASLISTEGDPDKKAQYIENARTSKINVIAPDINRSIMDFTVGTDDSILFGFNSIKGVGEKAAQKIIDLQPFNSIGDFLIKCHHVKGVNKKVFEALTYCGSLDCFGYKKSTLLSGFASFVFDYVNTLKDPNVPESNVINRFIELEDNYFDNSIPELSFLEILEKEKELLGIYLSSSPFEFIKKNTQHKNLSNFDTISKNIGKSASLLCRIDNVKTFIAKASKKTMCFLDITDENNKMEHLVVFADTYAKIEKKIKDKIYAIIKVAIRSKPGSDKLSLIVNDVIDLTEELTEKIKKIEHKNAIRSISLIFENIPSTVRMKSIHNIINEYVRAEDNNCKVNLIVKLDKQNRVKIGTFKINKIDVNFLRAFSKIKDIYITRDNL